MQVAQHNARFDWLAELAGAAALALAGGYAALKAAPSFTLPPPGAMTGAGFGGFAVGLLAMRLVNPTPRRLAIRTFELNEIEGQEDAGALLLDTIYEEPLLLEDVADDPLLLEDVADDSLLLVDALEAAQPDSRVVRLFAHQPIPTPGELKNRIDRHLAGAPRQPFPSTPSPAADASQALYAALDELKRSLR
jgi:hypothetical protein